MNPKLDKRLQSIRALLQQRALEPAAKELRLALLKFPGNIELLLLGAQLAATRGDHESEITQLQRCAAIAPGRAQIWHLLGRSLFECERHAEAAEAFAREAKLGGGAGALLNRAVALQAAERLDEAIAAYQAALAAGADGYTLRLNLGMSLFSARRYHEAMTEERVALEHSPNDPVALYNLGSCALELGEPRQARDYYLLSRLPAAEHAALYCANFLPELSPEALSEMHLAWGRKLRMPTQAEARTDSAPLTERRLRIGYLSGDFRIHPVMFFLEPVLAHHDRQRFEIFCYADVAKADRMTERAHALAEQWRDIAGRSDDEVAAMMAADDIDLLVDLAGHTSTRLRLMARRIAPVQLSYLGYAFTSGLDTIDYRLSDALLDKPGDERLYSERLLRLEPTCYTYQPPEGAPDAAAAPCLRNGYLTFGATSRAHKINPATIALWASALKACGNSRLLLIARLFSDPRAQERLAEDFAAEGIDASRLDFVGELPFEAYLEAHAKIDLLLDAVPWNGHTNTLHALWMGVPTLTLCGDHHCARFGEMIMRHLDLPRFIAADEDDFALRAAEIDREHHSLSDLRAGLRARLRQSPLCDHIGVTRAIEAAYLRAFAERREIRD